MNTYIVIQMQVDLEEQNGNDKTYLMSNIVRQVIAETKEEAIGKFVIGTNDMIAQKKLKIECYELTNLKSL